MSYGTDAPQGFQPRKHMGGSSWNGQLSPYKIADSQAGNLFKGDPVTLASGYLTIGIAGSATMGVFWGCKYQDANGTFVFSPYWPTATVTLGAAGADAFVIDDDSVLYDIQTSGAGLTQAMIGNNANFVAGAGSTVTGQSAYELDQTTIATGNATRNCKIVSLVDRTGNNFGDANNNAYVKFNNRVYGSSTGTVGV